MGFLDPKHLALMGLFLVLEVVNTNNADFDAANKTHNVGAGVVTSTVTLNNDDFEVVKTKTMLILKLLKNTQCWILSCYNTEQC